eukprot:TRINITY_DN56416_c0_g1_i1.p1 TRINITY_DN56416_c0_g1~~TRINITY_DN56416_c0_g1_i1.p1  ORF type:complete len:393 (-),score=48.62 TRINITY_DN56416_c0_g1_i1:56-1234(-)
MVNASGLTASPFAPKILSFIGLWAVSALCGASIRASLSQGTYNYSPSTTYILAEATKFLISLGCLCYTACADSSVTSGDVALEEGVAGKHCHIASGSALQRLQLRLLNTVREHTTVPLLGHLCGLSLLYAVQNNAGFPLFRLVDSASVFLMKASSTIITAVVSSFLGRPLGTVQWVAIALQFWALIVTQYDSCSQHANFPLVAYLWMLLSITLSTVAGFWNEFAVKKMSAPLALQNVYMYGFGIAFNLIAYWSMPPEFYGTSPKSFFDGYDWHVWLIVIANSFLGIVITAVYKYADVLIKTIAMASATVTLGVFEFLWISGKRPGTNEFVGTVVVFASVYAYMVSSKKLAEKAPLPRSPHLTAFLTHEGFVCLCGCALLLSFQTVKHTSACH